MVKNVLKVAMEEGFSALTLSIGILLFVFGKIYLQLFLPVITVVISFIVILLLNFIFSEKEKGFLRKAFGVYLSDDVVNEIIADPDKLTLGGEQKRISDICRVVLSGVSV